MCYTGKYMLSLLASWQLNLVLYVVCTVAFFQFYKRAIRGSKRDGAATVAVELAAGITVLLLVPFFRIQFPTDMRSWLLLAVAGIFYALNDRLQVTARRNLQVSVFSVVDQLSVVFLVIYSFTIFHEPFSGARALGAACIIFGNSVLFLRKNGFSFNKYVFLVALARLAFATAVSIDIGLSRSFNLPLYIALTIFIPAVLLVTFERIRFSAIKEELTGPVRAHFTMAGVLFGLSVFFSLRAFQAASSISLIAPLQATVVLFSVLVSYFLLKEEDGKIRKIIASLLTILGVYFTTR